MEILCRFQDKCKNKKCTFAHLTDLTQTSLCNFKSKCNKINSCKFLHPDDLKMKRKLCQYQDKCPHDECRFIHLDNLYRCPSCSKLTWSTTEVLTDEFMIDLIKNSKSEGHPKNLQCDFYHKDDNAKLLSEQSQSSVSETDVNINNTNSSIPDTSAINSDDPIDITKLFPTNVSLQQLLQVRADLDIYIRNKRNTKTSFVTRK